MRFWELTPEEFAHVANGYQRRQYDEWLRYAWVLCNISAMFGGDKYLKPSRLIGDRPKPLAGDVWA